MASGFASSPANVRHRQPFGDPPVVTKAEGRRATEAGDLGGLEGHGHTGRPAQRARPEDIAIHRDLESLRLERADVDQLVGQEPERRDLTD